VRERKTDKHLGRGEREKKEEEEEEKEGRKGNDKANRENC
jgi:hypothetical protein